MEEPTIQQNAPVPPQIVPGNDERTWAMFCHLSALAGYVIPVGNIVGPLILWNIQKEKYALVDQHGKSAINFQISMTIWILGGVILSFACIGIPIIFALAITDLVCVIIAAVQASNGKAFKYPLTIPFLK